MNPSLIRSLATLSRKYKTPLYLVGGSVRDPLLKRPVHDWDFACVGARRVAHAFAKHLGRPCIVLDDVHHIYRIVQTDGPEPVTLDFAELVGQTIEDDLARRDFSVNAMAQLFPGGKIIDPFGGRKDLSKKNIRCFNRANFKDDPLRLLRAFRFAGQLDFRIEGKTLRWIQADSRLWEKKRPAAERVREELLRFFGSRHASPALAAMDRCGLLTMLFPEVEAGRRVAVDFYGKGGVIKHALQSVENFEAMVNLFEDRESVLKNSALFKPVQTYLNEDVSGFPRRALLKLATFLHDIGKPATAQRIDGRMRFFGHEDVGSDVAYKRMEALRFSGFEVQQTARWVRHHMRLGNLAASETLTDKAIARYFRDLQGDGVGMILLSLADHHCYLRRSVRGQATDTVEKVAKRMLETYVLNRQTVLPKKLVDGHDLMKALKLKPSKLIGQLLAAIEDAQVEKKVTTSQEAIRFAKSVLPSLRA